jgi:lipase maturation factor 1
MEGPGRFIPWLFDSRSGLSNHLIPRWIFLRAFALVYLSAFYSLLFQIDGLIGPQGILPAKDYLAAVAQSLPEVNRFWFAPSLFWISAASPALLAITWLGLLAAVCAFFNLWPRLSLFICFVCFLSFVAASSDFSSYQSDGMLLEAGFISLFLAPPGLRPGWAAMHPPVRASYFLLVWEWFRIYFESGLVKVLSGDPQWRNFTALDEYYQNGPLPSWIGWYAAHLPHWFHVAATGATLLLEFGVVLMLFFPRRVRQVCFWIVTPWQIGVILTANYTFLNYLVLSLGFLLLDDTLLRRFIPARFGFSASARPTSQEAVPAADEQLAPAEQEAPASTKLSLHFRSLALAIAAVFLTWVGYVTTAGLAGMLLRPNPLPMAPVEALEPFRIANQYGLFAVMTRGRYEIEFQGSNDNQNWTAYPFRHKPQALNEAPGLYAPYQPRFDWNLWFASLGDWRQNQIVPITEEKLLASDASVLGLFRGNPFPGSPPRYVRAVLWQYWFTSLEEKRRTGNWWRRSLLGLYAPTLTLDANGRIAVAAEPDELPLHD